MKARPIVPLADGRGILDFLGGTGGTNLLFAIGVGLLIKELFDVEAVRDLFNRAVCDIELVSLNCVAADAVFCFRGSGG